MATFFLDLMLLFSWFAQIVQISDHQTSHFGVMEKNNASILQKITCTYHLYSQVSITFGDFFFLWGTEGKKTSLGPLKRRRSWSIWHHSDQALKYKLDRPGGRHYFEKKILRKIPSNRFSVQKQSPSFFIIITGLLPSWLGMEWRNIFPCDVRVFCV